MATAPRGKAPVKANVGVAPKKNGPAPVKREGLDVHEAEIVEAIRSDKGYREIADKYKVSKGTLIAWIKADTDRLHACMRAREEAAAECDERAETAIMEAKDPFELARAREMAVHLRWRAKARNPKDYGDKVQVDASLNIKAISDEDLAARLAKFGVSVAKAANA